ncbi:MAG: hypothetical protein O9267_04455 [Flavobacterium sp.]|uniref:hypothetical protein n=1 Tax=Flavobacterium sp. TaxID=239 RepID=UPI0022C90A66|nr:hypothetical protein [Flavobacterium sp.]MCZ8196838.1 hypothetical protein [Flavobacterium sp.]
MVFAQPGDDTVDGGLEGDDTPPVPVNGKLIYLGIAGLLFAVYTYRRNKKVA